MRRVVSIVRGAKVSTVHAVTMSHIFVLSVWTAGDSTTVGIRLSVRSVEGDPVMAVIDTVSRVISTSVGHTGGALSIPVVRVGPVRNTSAQQT